MVRSPCAIVLVAMSLLSGCARIGPTSDGKGYVTGDGNVRIIPAADRGAPIKLRGKDLRGHALSTPTPSSRATVINVWWSGCVECREEAPILRDAAREAAGSATFMGINIRETGRVQAQRFEERFRLPYPSFYDPGGRLLLEFHHSVPYAAIPTTIVLDGQLRADAVILGSIPSETTLRDVASEVLGRPAG